MSKDGKRFKVRRVRGGVAVRTNIRAGVAKFEFKFIEQKADPPSSKG